MIIGVLSVIAACFCWGFIFVVPQFMEGFSSLEVGLGRYFFYGLASTAVMLSRRIHILKNLPRRLWFDAFLLGLLGNVLYFPTLVMAMRYSGPAIAALIMGVSPISIALYGNSVEREVNFKNLALPCTLIAVGLVLVNMPALAEHSMESSLTTYIIGLLAGFAGLSMWTWYAVTSSRIIKKNPDIFPGDWTSIVGVATLVSVFLTAFLAFLFLDESQTLFFKFSHSDNLSGYLIGSMILGILCSWLGVILWNKGSSNLPLALAGQLLIFETIFGLTFVYLLAGKVPSFYEVAGILCMLSGIYAGFLLRPKAAASTQELS